ncbi:MULTISPECIES: phosphatase PAP2 family protein [unclassified Streptomyces]|uniref:phosphatase PAP2 family protein n=1 Tax=unclassified Streptomyces TaxID=2593676 RepID=UPI00339DC1AA
MILALNGASIDGSLYSDVVARAQHSPDWFDDTVSVWSTYGLLAFAVLAVIGWWRARRGSPAAAVTALAAPVVVVVAYGADMILKMAVGEVRPCQSLHVKTLEACPAPGDWSFPSNHAVIAAAAAMALVFVSRPLGVVASVAVVAMAASRVWVGAHYPHDVLAGVAVGGVVALVVTLAARRQSQTLAQWLTTKRLGALLLVS